MVLIHRGTDLVRETEYLVDNSAYSRARKAVVGERLQPLISRGLVYTCAPIELEAGRALDAGAYEPTLERRRVALIPAMLPEDVWERATTIQAILAGQSTHFAPSVVDLLIAACADYNGLTVLHYDADFETISAATGIPSEWVAPRGSADGPDIRPQDDGVTPSHGS